MNIQHQQSGPQSGLQSGPQNQNRIIQQQDGLPLQQQLQLLPLPPLLLPLPQLHGPQLRGLQLHGLQLHGPQHGKNLHGQLHGQLHGKNLHGQQHGQLHGKNLHGQLHGPQLDGHHQCDIQQNRRQHGGHQNHTTTARCQFSGAATNQNHSCEGDFDHHASYHELEK